MAGIVPGIVDALEIEQLGHELRRIARRRGVDLGLRRPETRAQQQVRCLRAAPVAPVDRR
jgi:hypothetical protein